MLLTNWLAKKDGLGGLAFPSEFMDGDVRLYGKLYGHPDFEDGEYVQTAIVTSYDGVVARTASGLEVTLTQEAKQYMNFLKAKEREAVILKGWNIEKGNLVGKTLDAAVVTGRVIRQDFNNNICVLEGGTRVFVDWLAKDPNLNVYFGPEELLAFCTEKCMPDIFCKHYRAFRKESCR